MKVITPVAFSYRDMSVVTDILLLRCSAALSRLFEGSTRLLIATVPNATFTLFLLVRKPHGSRLVEQAVLVTAVVSTLGSVFPAAFHAVPDNAQFWLANLLSLTVPLTVSLRAAILLPRLRADAARLVHQYEPSPHLVGSIARAVLTIGRSRVVAQINAVLRALHAPVTAVRNAVDPIYVAISHLKDECRFGVTETWRFVLLAVLGRLNVGVNVVKALEPRTRQQVTKMRVCRCMDAMLHELQDIRQPVRDVLARIDDNGTGHSKYSNRITHAATPAALPEP